MSRPKQKDYVDDEAMNPDMNQIRDKVLVRSAEMAMIDMAALEQSATESEDPCFLLEVYWLYRQKNLTEDALRVLEKVEEAYPEGDEAALLRADIYYGRGEKRRALAMWEEVSRSEDESDAAQAKMNLLYHRDKFRDAIAEYERLARRDPATDPKYYAYVLIPCYLRTGQFQKAKDMCLMMIEMHAFRREYLGLLGMAEEGLGDTNAAESMYATVLELAPDDLPIMGRLVNLHIRQFRWRSAWSVFCNAVKEQDDKNETGST